MVEGSSLENWHTGNRIVGSNPTASAKQEDIVGLRNWWRENRNKAELNRRSLALNGDQQLIAQQVPELVGMSEVEGMAYVLQEIQDWNKICTKEQAETVAARLLASKEAFEAQGLIMPYWAALWVLRTYQIALGLDVPKVALSVLP